MPQIDFYSWTEQPPGSEQLEIKALCLDEEIDSRIVRWTNRLPPYYFFLLIDGAAECVPPGADAPVDASDSLIVWSPGTTRVYGCRNRVWRHSWMIANGDILRYALQRCRMPLDTPIRFRQQNIFSHYLKLLYAELRTRNAPDTFVLGELTKLFVYEMARAMQQSANPIPEHLVRVGDYLEAHLDEDIGVSGMARMAALSVSGFIAQFKQFYGTSPMRYLNDMRMNTAAQMLQRQYLSIKEIAAAVGYDDQLYFSRRFREFHGTPPSVYRAGISGR